MPYRTQTKSGLGMVFMILGIILGCTYWLPYIGVNQTWYPVESFPVIFLVLMNACFIFLYGSILLTPDLREVPIFLSQTRFMAMLSSGIFAGVTFTYGIAIILVRRNVNEALNQGPGVYANELQAEFETSLIPSLRGTVPALGVGWLVHFATFLALCVVFYMTSSSRFRVAVRTKERIK